LFFAFDIFSDIPMLLLIVLSLLLLFPLFIDVVVLMRSPDVFAPVYVFVTTIFLHYYLASFPFLSTTEDYSSDLLSNGLLLVIVTILFFYMGYYWSNLYRISTCRMKRRKYYESVIIWASILFLLISITAEIWMLREIGGTASLMTLMKNRMEMFAHVSGFTLTMIRLSRPSFYMLMFVVFLRKKRRWYIILSLVIAGISVISVGLFTGNRGEFISPFLIAIIFTNYRHRRIRMVYLATFVIVAISFLFLYLIFIRAPYLQEDLARMDVKQTVQHLWNYNVGKGTFMEIRSVMDVIKGVPEKLNYQLGRTYLALSTSFIPRSIYPDKMPEASELFALAFYPERWLEGRGGARVSMIGEFYMNFGLFGVAIGSAILGSGMRRLYRVLPKNADPSKVLCYAIVMSSFYFLIRGNFVGVTVRFMTDWIPVWCVLSLASNQISYIKLSPLIATCRYSTEQNKWITDKKRPQ